MALQHAEKVNIMGQYALSERDTGSAEVQVALITHKITYLTEHLKQHKKDNHSRLGLLKAVHKRRKLLKYLHHSDMNRYFKLIGSLNIRHQLA